MGYRCRWRTIFREDCIDVKPMNDVELKTIRPLTVVSAHNRKLSKNVFNGEGDFIGQVRCVIHGYQYKRLNDSEFFNAPDQNTNDPDYGQALLILAKQQLTKQKAG